MKAKDILSQVEQTLRERPATYGAPYENLTNTANLWSEWVKHRHGVDLQFNAIDVCWMMVLLKASRAAYKQDNEDNYIDSIGYLTIAAGLPPL